MKAFTFLLVAVAACSTKTTAEGLTLAVSVEAASTPPRQGGTITLTTDRGVSVNVTRALLATGSVEIVACPSSTSLLERVGRALVPEAHAHSTTSATKLGTPIVESLLAEPATRMTVGTLHPPPARYCKVKYGARAADADAEGAPADGSMLDRTLLLEGTWSAVGSPPASFTLTTTLPFDAELDLTPAVDLGGSVTAGAVTLTKTLDRWFDGVDFTRGTADEQAAIVVENARKAMRAEAR